MFALTDCVTRRQGETGMCSAVTLSASSVTGGIWAQLYKIYLLRVCRPFCGAEGVQYRGPGQFIVLVTDRNKETMLELTGGLQ
jgi:hypothetical protein